MTIILTNNEARVIGCLMEKSVTTPDQYPLTLNALTNACNQKSARDPVMSISSGEVQQTARSLESKHVLRTEENFRKQTEKYSHRFCNTPFSDYQFDEAQFAVVCVLLLRGKRTPGEIRANSGRLHTFVDNEAVVAALNSLINKDGEALVAQLPRSAGRRDAEYLHLFGGEMPTVELTERPTQVSETTPAAPIVTVNQAGDAELSERLDALEQEVAELKAVIK